MHTFLLISYLFAALSCMIFLIKVEKRLNGSVSIGDLLIDLVLSSVPFLNFGIACIAMVIYAVLNFFDRLDGENDHFEKFLQRKVF